MKQLLLFLFLLCSTGVFAQDVIVKKDGSTIVCRVVELTSSEIVYKKWSDLNGSNYVMNRADASAINYENGKKVNLSEVNNLYKPHNQSDGTQQFNDRALLRIDAASNDQYKKVKTLRIIGWIGGVVIAGIGVYLMANAGGNDNYDAELRNGIIVTSCSVPWVAGFLIAAHHKKKQNDYLSAIPLYQHNIVISKGSSLDLNANLLSDRTNGKNTLGLGLRYNF